MTREGISGSLVLRVVIFKKMGFFSQVIRVNKQLCPEKRVSFHNKAQEWMIHEWIVGAWWVKVYFIGRWANVNVKLLPFTLL